MDPNYPGYKCSHGHEIEEDAWDKAFPKDILEENLCTVELLDSLFRDKPLTPTQRAWLVILICNQIVASAAQEAAKQDELDRLLASAPVGMPC